MSFFFLPTVTWLKALLRVVYNIFMCLKKKKITFWNICIVGLFEMHGTSIVPTVSIIAPEKLSASARRRQEIQVNAGAFFFPFHFWLEICLKNPLGWLLMKTSAKWTLSFQIKHSEVRKCLTSFPPVALIKWSQTVSFVGSMPHSGWTVHKAPEGYKEKTDVSALEKDQTNRFPVVSVSL